MKFSRAWLFFEQSGTFKRVFKSLGFDAYDVDISNISERYALNFIRDQVLDVGE